MPKLRTYNIFISHAWKHSDDYKPLERLLKKAPRFEWRNYSDAKGDPIIAPDNKVSRKKMEKELEDQIRPVHCVIVISGMYIVYSDWIQTEIDIAKRLKKPIIGVKPRGHERIPQAVQDVAKEMVSWNTNSIVSAIRKHALRRPRN
jgi:hypothetical protein